jgi:hypothetical protein
MSDVGQIVVILEQMFPMIQEMFYQIELRSGLLLWNFWILNDS